MYLEIERLREEVRLLQSEFADLRTQLRDADAMIRVLTHALMKHAQIHPAPMANEFLNESKKHPYETTGHWQHILDYTKIHGDEWSW